MSQIKSKSKLLHFSLIVSCMTMVSRVLGLVRDVVIAGYFGSSASADAFFVAFRIPNLLRRLFAEGAFSQAFVPVLSTYKSTKKHSELKKFVDYIAGTLGFILILVTVVGVVFSPIIIRIFAPGFVNDPAKLKLASSMLQITFFYLPLISLTAFAGAIMNTYGSFAIPSITPVLLNLSLIFATVWLSPYLSVAAMSLAWGVLIAGIMQLTLQVPFLSRLNLLPFPRWGWKKPGVQRVLKLMLPSLLGVSAAQINLLLDSIMASFLETGSVSWLYYSDRLTELPLGVFGVAIGSVLLPTLSKYHAKDSKDDFSKTIDWGIKLILLIALPATAALIILAEPILTTIFFHGKMSSRDIYMAGGSLKAFSLGLTAFMLVKVLAPAFYSKQNTKTPVKIALIALLINTILNLIFNMATCSCRACTVYQHCINGKCFFVVLLFTSKTNIYI